MGTSNFARRMRIAAVVAASGWCIAAGPAVAADQPDAPLASASTPASAGSDSAVSAAQADLDAMQLGEPFRSRAAGIELRPPAGGTELREPGGADVVRFLYPQRGWDIHVKRTSSSKPISLSLPRTPSGALGLLELTEDQIKAADPSAQILDQEVKNYPPYNVGVVVARHHVATSRELLQEAIFQRDPTDFYIIQFLTQLDPAAAADQAPTDAAREQSARQMFALMLGTVRLLDWSELKHEQNQRLYRTEELYHELSETRLKAAMVPQQVMRVLRDGRDLGFIVQTEQLATHAGHDGIEVNLRSHIETEAPKPAGPAPIVPGGQVINLPRIGPGSSGSAAAAAPAAPQPTRVDRLTKLFVTFDRRHEDWSIQTRVDTGQLQPTITSELGNTDMEVHEVLDREALAQHEVTDPNDPKQPPVHEREKYTLSVTDYTRTGNSPPVDQDLPPYYLPAALAQMLPRLLPLDTPSTYMFYSWVSEEHKVMARYVDVLGERDVNLDGKPIRAVAIADRIGVDGSPTTTYMTRHGELLGSVSPEQKLVVLPSDAATINALWHGANITADSGGSDNSGIPANSAGAAGAAGSAAHKP